MKVTDDLPGKTQPIDEEQLKATLLAQHKQTEVKKSDFPTEVIDLPSKGLLYPEGHPLSGGTIEMKYMTAKEEDILASQNLIKQGVVIDKLLESMIITPMNYNDLLVGDKNAIMMAARVLGYGKNYDIEYSCPNCSENNTLKSDLTSFEDKHFDDTLITPHNNEFKFTLPQSKREITFKLLTHGDDNNITKELKALQKTGASKEVTTRLSHIITSIDGNADKGTVRNFVNNELFAMDSKALRDYIATVTPDVDTNIDFECLYCTHTEDIQLPIDVNFFWPRS